MLNVALYALLLTGPQDDVKPILFSGLGTHSIPIQTSNPEAQKWFTQGVAFMFAFNHDEAVLAFEQAAAIDKECAMAYWGIATALGPNINNPAVDPAAAEKAWKAVMAAQTYIGDRKGLEKDLIDAVTVRYSPKPDADRGPLDGAYANAMRKLAALYPKDANVLAMTAEALMDLHPWDLWKHDGTAQPWTPEIKGLIENALAVNSKHPLALHLYIHTTEASGKPQDGLTAARTLLNLNPGLGHMVHMPSHTFVRTGDWEAAIKSNQMAIDADNKYVAQRPKQGFYLFYMSHNHQMLAFAAMMVGKSELAIDGMDHMIESTPPEILEAYAPLLDGYLAVIYEVRIRFGKWDEILAMPDPGPKFPVMQTMRYMSRAVSFAVKGDKMAARAEQAKFYQAMKRVPDGYTIGNNSAADVLLVAESLMNGEILLGEGRTADSVKTLTRAVAYEDKLKYNEPPDWLQPTRHALGAVLVKAKRFKEAEAVYREDLKRLPGNGWSAFGLSQSLKGQNRLREASVFTGLFEQVWKGADMHIDSSCLCVEGKK